MTDSIRLKVQTRKFTGVLASTLCALVVTACGGAQCPVCPVHEDRTPVSTFEGGEPEAPDQIKHSEMNGSAETVDEVTALTRLFTAENVDTAWFDDAFLTQVPTAKIEQIVAGTRSLLGEFEDVSKTQRGYEAHFEKGTLPCAVSLDERGRITGLWVHPPQLSAATFEETAKRLEDLSGQVSVLVMDGMGKTLYSRSPDDVLAVGSAFKLAVLSAVRKKIGGKQTIWNKPLELKDEHRSLPSGQLHAWPTGSALTVSTLSNLMISISDNTATDLLLDWVGKKNVEKLSSQNRPFLSTREAFVLKAETNEELRKRYLAADETEQRSILAEIESLPLPATNGLSKDVTANVEWHFSARELCRLISDVADLPALQINPGLADKREFDQVAFKGGSELGILNYTTWLKKGERSACVVATWNDDKAVPADRFAEIYSTLLAATRNALTATKGGGDKD